MFWSPRMAVEVLGFVVCVGVLCAAAFVVFDAVCSAVACVFDRWFPGKNR